MGTSSINGPFSMAMLNNQRVGFMDKQNVRCQNSWIITDLDKVDLWMGRRMDH